MKNDKSIARLLRRVRAASGYGRWHKWEPATDYGSDNPNAPFKPQTFQEHPDAKLFGDIADRWDGGLSDWEHALEDARVGSVLDFYVTKIGDELVTNIEVWIVSNTEIRWSDCGGKVNTIKLE